MHEAAQSLGTEFLAEATLKHARALFPHTNEGKVYLNHAGTAPMSVRVVEAIEAHLRERSVGKIETYLAHDADKIEKCRARIAALINAESADRIAFAINTSDALNIIASGLQWNSGDRVLLHESEFPANVYPFVALKRHGVELDVIPAAKGNPTPQLIAEALTPRTRLVTLSAVQFLTGYRADLAAIGELCRCKNVLFVVDAIQAVGAVKIDVQNLKVDAIAAGCQKWQMGPQGTAWLYLTEELQARIQQSSLGWLGVADPWNFSDFNQPLAPTARRYEGGTKNIPGILGLDAAIATLLEFDPSRIERHIRSLTQLLISGLQTLNNVRVISPTAEDERAGIVTLQLDQRIDARGVFKRLLERNITIALRDGKLRYAPHFYNSVTEIAIAVGATREAMQE
jgi:selenocysteine lyase/cysteine desulfurase